MLWNPFVLRLSKHKLSLPPVECHARSRYGHNEGGVAFGFRDRRHRDGLARAGGRRLRVLCDVTRMRRIN